MGRHQVHDAAAVVRVTAWAFTIALGAVSAFVAPYRFATDDAVSYLDVADQYLQGHWRAALNGYWSPMYSLVLAGAESIVRPAPATEILFVRCVNFVLLLVALATFERLLQHVIAADTRVPKAALLAAGYALFLWSSLVWIGVRTDTPDMLAAASFYGAASFAVPRAGGRPWARSVAVGALCALAYLSKTGMLPAAAALLVAFVVAPFRMREVAARAALGVTAFGLVAVALVGPLSHARHRLTVGDSGSLNYAWYVYPTRRALPNEHWQGGPEGFGTPAHPTRRVFANPDAFEFDGPVHGTYPPWTDPSYWYEGLDVHFNTAGEERVLESNVGVYARTFLPFLAAACIVIYCVGGVSALAGAARTHWPLLVAAAAGFGAYAAGTDLTAADIATQPSTRFVAPFAAVALVALVGAVQAPDASGAAAIARVSSLTAACIITTLIVVTVRDAAAAAAQRPVPAEVAAQLHNFGLAAGDRVAILGRKFDRDCDHEFWARLGRFRIVDQVPDEWAALHLPQQRWDDLCAVLASTGARALVFKPTGASVPSNEWTALSDGYYAYRLAPRPGIE